MCFFDTENFREAHYIDKPQMNGKKKISFPTISKIDEDIFSLMVINCISWYYFKF